MLFPCSWYVMQRGSKPHHLHSLHHRAPLIMYGVCAGAEQRGRLTNQHALHGHRQLAGLYWPDICLELGVHLPGRRHSGRHADLGASWHVEIVQAADDPYHIATAHNAMRRLRLIQVGMSTSQVCCKYGFKYGGPYVAMKGLATGLGLPGITPSINASLDCNL